MIAQPVSSPPDPSTGARLVDTHGRTLPLRAAALRADARAGLAAVVLEHTYENTHAQPLRVTYQVPLPPDAAVAGFRFVIDGAEVLGRVEPRAAARERFERAVLEGKTAALLDEERSSLFTQEVGNVPPGAKIEIRLEIRQRLDWVAEGDRSGWQWRFPTAIAPRFLAEPGRVADADKVTTAVTAEPLPELPREGTTEPIAESMNGIGLDLRLVVRDTLTGRLDSTSHRLVVHEEGSAAVVALQHATLDRDVVVTWPVAGAEPGVSFDIGRPSREHPRAGHAYALLTVTPPAMRPSTTLQRDLVVLLDTSGSMHGEPLQQAKHVVAALLDTLGEADTLELVEFSDRPRRLGRRAERATPRFKAKAQSWLASLRAGGGTQMRDGIIAALSTLRAEAQRQVVLVTDGLIGFEDEIVSEIANRLPAGSRVHTVGIGSAVNRSLTGPAARAGRGQEVIIGLGEDPERAARRLCAHTDAPVVVDVSLEGEGVLEVAPQRIPDLFAGAPVRIAVALQPGGASLRLRGRTATGAWEGRVELPAMEPGQGTSSTATAFARERVEDLEVGRASGRPALELDQTLTALGVDFQIATRLTSWIAVSDEVMVDPTEPTRHEVMPHALPHGMSALGLGLRSAAPMIASAGPPPAPMQAVMAGPPGAPPPPPSARPSVPRATKKGFTIAGLFGRGRAAPPEQAEAFSRSEVDEEATDGERPSLYGQLQRRGDTWVLVFSVPTDTPWTLPSRLELELDDGRRIGLTVTASHSTRTMPVPAGAQIRLVLEASSGSDDPAPDEVVAAHWREPSGRTWEIRLGG